MKICGILNPVPKAKPSSGTPKPPVVSPYLVASEVSLLRERLGDREKACKALKDALAQKHKEVEIVKANVARLEKDSLAALDVVRKVEVEYNLLQASTKGHPRQLCKVATSFVELMDRL